MSNPNEVTDAEVYRFQAISDIACLKNAMSDFLQSRTSATSDAAGWQPIATAPQDGTVIDLWDTCKFSGGRLCFMQAVTHYPGDPFYSVIKGQSGRSCVRSTANAGTVSHWMPSPQSPAAAMAAGGRHI